MPQFGKDSLARLSTCHPDLQKLFNEVIKHYDCTILEGHRSDEDQLKAFNAGKSKIKSGGKHNHAPHSQLMLHHGRLTGMTKTDFITLLAEFKESHKC